MKRIFPKASLKKDELGLFKYLKNPQKIQNFLESLPINFDDTCFSPRKVIENKKAHCMEGAMFAAAALWFNGEKPLIMDLITSPNDEFHVVALFKRFGCWGAISKTNHAVLRYREPIYKTLRELALSYFHEYFTDDGKKNLRRYSKPLDLSFVNEGKWITSEKDPEYVNEYLDRLPDYQIITRQALKIARRADKIEIKVGKLTEWQK